jgi:hypothetical protein
MRIVLALLMCCGVAFGQDTTKYFKSVDYGWNWQRGKFRGGLILPTDTTNNKLGIAQIDANCYAWSGTKWSKINSSDTTFLVRYYRKNQVDSAILANSPALTLQDVTTNGKTTTDTIIAASFKRTGGTSSQFLKANGSVDNSTYLTSASLTGYVPYTGATSDVDLGAFALNAAFVKINGTNGNGHLHLRHQASDATATGQSTVLFANMNGDLKWKNAGNYYTTLQTYKNNADRIYTYQNKSYTLADSTTLADSVSALRTAVNAKGSGTVTSVTLGRGITGTSPITTTGTIGLDTTKSYTWTGQNTFNTSAISSSLFSSTSAASTREQIIKATVSDATNDGWFVYNGTSVDASFIPSFGGICNTNSGRSALQFVGFTTSTNDAGTNPLIQIQGFRTTSATDPANGTLTTVTTRPIFSVSNTGSPSNLLVNANGTISMSSLATGIVYSNAGVLTSTNPSDSTLKNSIEDIPYGLNDILKLKPKTYYYNSDSTKTYLKYGFIAQDVQNIMPKIVRKLEPENPESKLGLESEAIYVAMVKAIQQLEARVKELENKLNAK